MSDHSFLTPMSIEDFFARSRHPSERGLGLANMRLSTALDLLIWLGAVAAAEQRVGHI